jgi:hypothetical protein
MGLLDDAIKEHLELKRRHGADPGEVARLEHEALGPARRDPAPAAMVDEPVGAEAVAEPVAQDDPYLDDDAAPYDEVPAEERLEAPIHHVAPEVVEPEPEPTAAAEPEPPPAEPVADVDQPTRQFSLEEVEDASQTPGAPPPADAPAESEPPPPAEDVVPADDEPDAEDVLEETPEFLQETPEHDRLWFEQKPPRDFDF